MLHLLVTKPREIILDFFSVCLTLAEMALGLKIWMGK